MIRPLLMVAYIYVQLVLTCLGQTLSVGKIDNSGLCSFTAINVSNLTYKIVCGGKGLNPEQANKLSQILSVVTKNKLELSDVLKSLQLLAEQSKVQNIQQSCPDGFCNAGSVQAPQVVNDNRQFRAPMAPPPLKFSSRPLPAVQRPVKSPTMSDVEYQAKLAAFNNRRIVNQTDDHPGVEIIASVDETFLNPAFLVRCQKPCIPSQMAIRRGDYGVSVSGLFSRNQMLRTDDPRAVVFVLGDQTRLLNNESVELIVRSTSMEDVGSVTAEAYVE